MDCITRCQVLLSLGFGEFPLADAVQSVCGSTVGIRKAARYGGVCGSFSCRSIVLTVQRYDIFWKLPNKNRNIFSENETKISRPRIKRIIL